MCTRFTLHKYQWDHSVRACSYFWMLTVLWYYDRECLYNGEIDICRNLGHSHADWMKCCHSTWTFLSHWWTHHLGRTGSVLLPLLQQVGWFCDCLSCLQRTWRSSVLHHLAPLYECRIGRIQLCKLWEPNCRHCFKQFKGLKFAKTVFDQCWSCRTLLPSSWHDLENIDVHTHGIFV